MFRKLSVTIKKCDEIFRLALGWIFRILACIKKWVDPMLSDLVTIPMGNQDREEGLVS